MAKSAPVYNRMASIHLHLLPDRGGSDSPNKHCTILLLLVRVVGPHEGRQGGLPKNTTTVLLLLLLLLLIYVNTFVFFF